MTKYTSIQARQDFTYIYKNYPFAGVAGTKFEIFQGEFAQIFEQTGWPEKQFWVGNDRIFLADYAYFVYFSLDELLQDWKIVDEELRIKNEAIEKQKKLQNLILSSRDALEILNFHPDQPGKKENLKFIGYWNSEHYFSRQTFNLPMPQNCIGFNWNEKEKVIFYIKNGTDFSYWKGKSFCRFGCQNVDMGSKDLTDEIYVWPEGYAHYLEKHNVKPPRELINHILNIL
jgi:hypothetical protein